MASGNRLIRAGKNASLLLHLSHKFSTWALAGRKFAEGYLNLEELLSDPLDQTLSQKDIRSAYLMAGFFTALGNAYAEYLAVEPTETQKKGLAIIGALAVLEDRLCDELSCNYSIESLDEMFYDTHHYQPVAHADLVVRNLILHLKEIMPMQQHPEYYQELAKLHQLQQSSRGQIKSEDPEWIWDISTRKSGQAALADLMIMNPGLSPDSHEYKAFFSLGYIQLGDDLMDRQDDQEAGISTPATLLSLDELKARITALRNQTLGEFASAESAPGAKLRLMFYAYTIAAIDLAYIEEVQQGRDMVQTYKSGRGAGRLLGFGARFSAFAANLLGDLLRYDPTTFATLNP